MIIRQSNQKGFTLIEVLVSLTLFALGMLGLGLHLGQSIKTSINTHIYPTALQIASQTIELLNEDLRHGTSLFQSSLHQYENPRSPLISTDDSIANQFSVALNTNAISVDAQNKPLLTTAPQNLTSPFTVNFVVTYQISDNDAISFPVSYIFSL